MPALFSLNEDRLARKVVGRTLICGSVRATILEAKAFPRTDTEKPLYRALLEMAPGGVYTSRQFQSVLMHVLAQGGGCIAIRAIEVDGRTVEGPGRVTAELGLTQPKVTGRLRELKNGDLKLEMAVQPSPPPPRSPRPTQAGLGNSAVARNMPGLIKRYQSRKTKEPNLTLLAVVNEALASCQDEAALRRWVRG